jgi:hypothetical protein
MLASADLRQSSFGATGPPGPRGYGSLENVPELLREEYASSVRPELLDLFGQNDGAAKLVSVLPRLILPAEVASSGGPQREWELCGLFYLNLGRWHEALAVLHSLYEHMLQFQQESDQNAVGGLPPGLTGFPGRWTRPSGGPPSASASSGRGGSADAGPPHGGPPLHAASREPGCPAARCAAW